MDDNIVFMVWMMINIQDTSAKSAIALQRLTPEARLALKKLRLGMIPDPESYLSSFVGTHFTQDPPFPPWLPTRRRMLKHDAS